jgi:hypothetical protein
MDIHKLSDLSDRQMGMDDVSLDEQPAGFALNAKAAPSEQKLL